MTDPVWLVFVLMAILLWSATCLLYKAGERDGSEEHICLKYSVCVGMVFFVIAVFYLIIREEPFSIWESAARYWPMTLFGIVYAVVNIKDMSITRRRCSPPWRESAAVRPRCC